MDEELKTIVPEGAEQEEEIIQAEKLTDEDRELIREILEKLQPLREKLNPVLFETLARAAGYPKGKYPAISPYPKGEYGYPYPYPKAAVEKALKDAKLPKEVQSQIAKALEEAEMREREAIEKEKKELFERMEALEKQNTELKTELAKQEEANRLRTFTEVAREEYRNLPIKPEELGVILLKAEETLEEKPREDLKRILKGADEVYGKLPQLEIGTTSEAEGNDAESELEAKATELMKTSGISKAQARAQILKENRELFKALREKE